MVSNNHTTYMVSSKYYNVFDFFTVFVLSKLSLPNIHKVIWFFRSNTNNFQTDQFWGCRIHRLHLCRGVKLPAYNTKLSDDKASVMLEL